MRWTRFLLVVALISAACAGDDGGPDADGLIDELTTTTSTAAPDSTTTLRPPTPTDPPPREDPTIGSLVIPCRPAEAVALPSRPGVSDEAIVIGTGSDRGGIGTPGVGVGIVEMIEVLADHCNSFGGLHGRDLRVVEYDAAAFEATERVEEACAEVVALVGHSFLQTVETALAAGACGLPLFTGGTDVPTGVPFLLHGHLAAVFTDPANASSVVLVGPDTPLAAAERAVRRQAIEASGGLLTVAGEVAYPIDGVPDWESITGLARATGAGQVHLDGGCDQAVLPFTDVADRAGWRPVVVVGPSAYDAACFGSAQSDRLLIELPFLPFEDGTAAPAIAAHAALLDQIGAPRTGAGLLAATEFWRWASAAEECLVDPDPGCFTAARAAQVDWTGGGLHPPVAADGSSEGCAVVVGIDEGRFVRRLPSEEGVYDCAPERSVVVAPLL